MSEKKERIYYGAKDPIPKGYTRRASMKEAAEANKISYYGIKQADSRVLSLITPKHKTPVDERSQLLKKLGELRGRVKKLGYDIKYSKKQDVIDFAKEELPKAKKEMIEVENRLVAIEATKSKTTKKATTKAKIEKAPKKVGVEIPFELPQGPTISDIERSNYMNAELKRMEELLKTFQKSIDEDDVFLKDLEKKMKKKK